MNKRHALLALVLASSLLAACGGGSGNDAPSDPVATPSGSVPPSAWVSLMAYFSYTASLPASDSATPLRVDEVQPPTSETATPSPLN